MTREYVLRLANPARIPTGADGTDVGVGTRVSVEVGVGTGVSVDVGNGVGVSVDVDSIVGEDSTTGKDSPGALVSNRRFRPNRW